MSHTFVPRPSVKTTGRGASNNRSSLANNKSRSTQTAGKVGSSPATTSTTSSSRRGSHSQSGPRARGEASSTSNTTRPKLQRDRMDDSSFGATPQRPGGLASHQRNPDDGSERQSGQYVGGFTKFEPSTKKRQQVSEMARKETEEYERYKQQNAVKYCNYVGTTGGGEMTEDMARRRQANDVRNQKLNRLQNQQRLRNERKEVEQREIDIKRSGARKKAEENSRRERHVDASDIRRKRESFLRQLESQTTAENPGPGRHTAVKQETHPSPSPSRPINPGSRSHAAVKVEAQPPPSHAIGLDRLSLSDRSHGDDDFAVKCENPDPEEDFPDEMLTLMDMFPDLDVDYLYDLYMETGSVDAVLDVIGV